MLSHPKRRPTFDSNGTTNLKKQTNICIKDEDTIQLALIS